MYASVFLLGDYFGIVVKGGNCQYIHRLNLKTTSILLRSCCLALGKGKPSTQGFSKLGVPWNYLESFYQNLQGILPESTGAEHRRVLLSLLMMIWGVFEELPGAALHGLQEP